MLTDQQAFDIAALGMLNQGRKSSPVDAPTECLYRHKTAGGDVLKCGVGFLLPDDWVEEHAPDSHQDDTSIANIAGDFGLPIALSNVDIGLLTGIQEVHDSTPINISLIEHWRGKLRSLAKDYNLNTDAIDTWEANQRAAS